MKRHNIFKKLQAAILTMAMSISLFSACTGPSEKPEEDKIVEDAGIKESDVPASNAKGDSSDANIPDSPGKAESETDSLASSGDDVSGRKWNSGYGEVIVTQGTCDFHAFLSLDGKESWIYKVTIHEDGLKKLSFPAKVNDAPVTRIGYVEEPYEEDSDWYYTIFSDILEPWHDLYSTSRMADNITAIEFPATLTRIEPGTFCGLKKLEKIEIPDGIKELTPYSFAACPKLTEVKLPAGLTKLNVRAFDKSKAISKLTISSNSENFKTKDGFLLSKDSQNLTWAVPAMTEVIIPEEVTTVEDNALFATKATKVVIPKSVRDIGSCALSGEKIEKLELKKGNKVFKMDGNCLYNISDKSLAAIVVKQGMAKISSEVEILGEGISVMGHSIECVDIPRSVNKVIEDWMFFPEYVPDVVGEPVLVKVYFYGTKPPQIVSEVPGDEFTALPIFNEVYVPKKAKKAYIRWADDRDGLEWKHLKTF